MIHCTKSNGIGLIKVECALSAATVDTFREQLSDWQSREQEIRNFVVDLKEVEFMDSAGLGTLIAALKRVTEQGGDMKLACLQKKPRMVFEITRAYKVFEIYNSVDEAIRAFSS
jgi:anti-sigma B factor antagonist